MIYYWIIPPTTIKRGHRNPKHQHPLHLQNDKSTLATSLLMPDKNTAFLKLKFDIVVAVVLQDLVKMKSKGTAVYVEVLSAGIGSTPCHDNAAVLV
jgi:hypothetical protein